MVPSGCRARYPHCPVACQQPNRKMVWRMAPSGGGGAHDCLPLTGESRRCGLVYVFTNNIKGILAACLGGKGITMLTEWNVCEGAHRGRLETVTFEGAGLVDLGIWSVYPSARMVPAKHRVFVVALEVALTPCLF